MTLKEAILTVVNSRKGINQYDLAMGVMSFINPNDVSSKDLALALFQLTMNNDVVVVACHLPDSPPAAIHGIYFPKGTKIEKVING